MADTTKPQTKNVRNYGKIALLEAFVIVAAISAAAGACFMHKADEAQSNKTSAAVEHAVKAVSVAPASK